MPAAMALPSAATRAAAAPAARRPRTPPRGSAALGERPRFAASAPPRSPHHGAAAHLVTPRSSPPRWVSAALAARGSPPLGDARTQSPPAQVFRLPPRPPPRVIRRASAANACPRAATRFLRTVNLPPAPPRARQPRLPVRMPAPPSHAMTAPSHQPACSRLLALLPRTGSPAGFHCHLVSRTLVSTTAWVSRTTGSRHPRTPWVRRTALGAARLPHTGCTHTWASTCTWVPHPGVPHPPTATLRRAHLGSPHTWVPHWVYSHLGATTPGVSALGASTLVPLGGAHTWVPPAWVTPPHWVHDTWVLTCPALYALGAAHWVAQRALFATAPWSPRTRTDALGAARTGSPLGCTTELPRHHWVIRIHSFCLGCRTGAHARLSLTHWVPRWVATRSGARSHTCDLTCLGATHLGATHWVPHHCATDAHLVPHTCGAARTWVCHALGRAHWARHAALECATALGCRTWVAAAHGATHWVSPALGCHALGATLARTLSHSAPAAPPHTPDSTHHWVPLHWVRHLGSTWVATLHWVLTWVATHWVTATWACTTWACTLGATAPCAAPGPAAPACHH
ncbi:hypothetical protein GPJ56_004548 [Histomonas meleagridis]|nr:hypothetical protein GPJ56_004548 [Histomonas meleagridis]